MGITVFLAHLSFIRCPVQRFRMTRDKVKHVCVSPVLTLQLLRFCQMGPSSKLEKHVL